MCVACRKVSKVCNSNNVPLYNDVVMSLFCFKKAVNSLLHRLNAIPLVTEKKEPATEQVKFFREVLESNTGKL
jgi:hypothetical protein